MIHAIAFDLDGVLVDAPHLHRAALDAALIDSGLEPVSDEVHERTLNGLPTKKKLELLGVAEEKIPAIAKRKQERTIELIEKFVSPDPQMIAKVSALREHYPIACCSNSIRASVDKLLEAAGLASLMDFTLSNEDVPHPKPSGVIYEVAARLFKVAPHEMLVLEDAAYGRIAASRAGARLCPIRDVHWELEYVAEMIQAHNDTDLILLPKAPPKK